jgi:ribonuclease P protein component
LHSNRDFGRIMHRQQKAAGRHVVVLVLPRPRRLDPRARLGAMISTKVAPSAVRRHQLKRWVRELFRLRLKATLHGHDVVVLFRRDPPADAHRQLDDEISALVAKALAATADPGRRGGGGRR